MEGRKSDYERLIEPIEERMLHMVWSVTQNAEDAEEALQEALIIVWRKMGRVRRHPNPHALILRICMNCACDIVRRNVRRQRRETSGEHATAGSTRTPAQELAAREQESIVMRAIAQLSRNQSAAVVMRLVQGLSYGAIAEILGCKDATARKHVARGRERLRELLAPMAGHLVKDIAQ